MPGSQGWTSSASAPRTSSTQSPYRRALFRTGRERPDMEKAPAEGALRRDAHPSASITSNSSFARSFSRWSRNFSMSKRFFSSQSAVYWKLGCFVRSYLSDRNGLTPRSWRMHLPPSSTASSSTLANSMQHCQVKNSFFLLFIHGIL